MAFYKNRKEEKLKEAEKKRIEELKLKKQQELAAANTAEKGAN